MDEPNQILLKEMIDYNKKLLNLASNFPRPPKLWIYL